MKYIPGDHSKSTFVHRGRGGSTKSEQYILNLKFFLLKKRTRGEGGQKVDIIGRMSFLNGLHVPSIGFAKSEKSASDLAPGGLYRLKYRKFFQKERHV